MTEDTRPPAERKSGGTGHPGSGDTFWSSPWPLRACVLVYGLAALGLPLTATRLGPDHPAHPAWTTVLLLLALSMLNIEIGRAVAGGLSHAPQPDTALTAWAFAAALLLPTPWLLVVVPLTYVHAWWRGHFGSLWRWVRSGFVLVIAAVAAAVVRHLLSGDQVNWMEGNGGRELVTMLVAAATFLAVESALFVGAALTNHRASEPWVWPTFSSASYYGTEGAVLLIGGLLSAVWTGGAWYVPLFVPIYAFAQRAAFHEPLRARAQVAAELASKNFELEEANQFKIDLLGMLGHEIANPLTAIAGHAEIGAEALRNGDDVAAVRSSLEVVDRNASQIKAVLREVLAMVSSDGGTLTARREHCLVEPRLRESVAELPAERRPVLDVEPDLVALVQPGHLDQIVANLLTNADKYAGGATTVRACTTDTGAVCVSVEDAGPGIAPGFRRHLFQRLSRDTDRAGAVPGTGLGLFISRELARVNGGDLHHENVRPTGSRFVLTLDGPAYGDPLLS